MAKYTAAQLSQLRAIKASGVLTSEIDGVRTTFRSMAELDRIIADVEADQGQSAGAVANRVTLLGFRQG